MTSRNLTHLIIWLHLNVCQRNSVKQRWLILIDQGKRRHPPKKLLQYYKLKAAWSTNLGQNCWESSIYFLTFAHITIVSKEKKWEPSPPPIQSVFGLKTNVCITLVGETSIYVAAVSIFARMTGKKGVFVMCLNEFCPRFQP